MSTVNSSHATCFLSVGVLHNSSDQLPLWIAKRHGYVKCELVETTERLNRTISVPIYEGYNIQVKVPGNSIAMSVSRRDTTAESYVQLPLDKREKTTKFLHELFVREFCLEKKSWALSTECVLGRLRQRATFEQRTSQASIANLENLLVEIREANVLHDYHVQYSCWR